MAFANLIGVPFSAGQVAIAVSHSHIGDGHIGIGFHSAKAGPQVLHLAWHQRLEVHAIPNELQMCWAAETLPTPPSASKQIAAFIRAVASRGPSINYGIDFLAARGSFSANGTYKAPKGSDGLTCSTFVVELLRACAVNVIKVETWKPSAENIAWGNLICDHLAKSVTADHVAAVRKNVNGLRVRPFEVAGATHLGPEKWPADFESVQQPATNVGSELSGICPPAAFFIVHQGRARS